MKNIIFTILLLATFFGSYSQSVTITPTSDSTNNHARHFFSGTRQNVLTLENAHLVTQLQLINTSGYGRGSFSGSDAQLVIYHPGGDIKLQNSLTPVQIVKLAGNGNFAVGNIDTPSAGLHVKEFSKLGEDAPAIKIKKFTGTTVSGQGNCNIVNIGVPVTKVLDYKVLVAYNSSGTSFVPEEYTLNPDYKFSVYLSSSNIYICLHAGNSSLITSKPYSIFLTYEQ
jgi:hypothetical protein